MSPVQYEKSGRTYKTVAQPPPVGRLAVLIGPHLGNANEGSVEIPLALTERKFLFVGHKENVFLGGKGSDDCRDLKDEMCWGTITRRTWIYVIA